MFCYKQTLRQLQYVFHEKITKLFICDNLFHNIRQFDTTNFHDQGFIHIASMYCAFMLKGHE